jgi:hypothetical protein
VIAITSVSLRATWYLTVNGIDDATLYSEQTPTAFLSRRIMTTRDTTALTDISKIKPEADGSFKRVASVFRSFIEKGGQFAPEKGIVAIIFP